jgi:hypothetical protein
MKAGFLTVAASAVLLGSVSVAGAQQPPQPPPVPPPAASVPPTPAALGVPDPFAGFRPGPRDLYRSPDGSDRFQHLSRYPAHPIVLPPIYSSPYYPFGYVYGTPYYETSMAETYRMSMAESYLRRQRETPRGGLLLEGVPAGAQVFVDGQYAGLAQDFGVGGGAINLDIGSHHVELRAAGYETLTFSVRIEPNSLVRYRGDMQRAIGKPAAAATPPQPAAVAAKSFYVIPGCYAGDKPPAGTLPKGCDVKKLQTRK